MIGKIILLFGGGLRGATFAQIAILLAGMVSGIAVARSLGPTGRGTAIAPLWPGILIMLGDMGLGFAFAYYAAREKDRISDLWTLAWLVGGIVGCSLAVFGWFILPLYVAPLRLAARVSFQLDLLAIPLVLINGYQAYLLLGVGFVADNSLIRMASGLCYAVSALLLAILDAAAASSPLRKLICWRSSLR